MQNSWENRSDRMLGLLDRTLERGAFAGIVLSRMLHGLMPNSMKTKKRLPYFIDDRRRDRRIRVDRTVACHRDGQETQRVHLINISRGGMYVETDTPSDVGEELSFNFSGRNLGPFLRTRGRVTRRAERGMAVQFV
ncbi:MAG TPA: PilZ domain-containing protein [Deltaproteobacteria bacterium]|nr:PilZ domain-containing protein [Deltaproteobacteria bacterium]HQI81099.1 PilZ domain-containing protein [Deltaproteobacteria bacterium]